MSRFTGFFEKSFKKKKKKNEIWAKSTGSDAITLNLTPLTVPCGFWRD